MQNLSGPSKAGPVSGLQQSHAGSDYKISIPGMSDFMLRRHACMSRFSRSAGRTGGDWIRIAVDDVSRCPTLGEGFTLSRLSFQSSTRTGETSEITVAISQSEAAVKFQHASPSLRSAPLCFPSRPPGSHGVLSRFHPFPGRAMWRVSNCAQRADAYLPHQPSRRGVLGQESFQTQLNTQQMEACANVLLLQISIKAQGRKKKKKTKKRKKRENGK